MLLCHIYRMDTTSVALIMAVYPAGEGIDVSNGSLVLSHLGVDDASKTEDDNEEKAGEFHIT